MESLVSYWNGKRVLVTGHTGFKGAWLSLWLHRMGAHVTGFSLDPPSSPFLFDEAHLDSLVESVKGDVGDATKIRQTVLELQPDFVFHLAAQPIVRESYRDPLATLHSNVMGTACLLDALRNVPSLAGAVIVTSDKCYDGTPPPEGHRESSPMGGNDPYSVSKGCAELITASWRKSFGHELPPIASARAGNVIGGGDWGRDRLIPDAVRALEARQELLLRHPGAVRPWQHVLDVLWGYLRLGEKLAQEPLRFARGWNFAPEPRSVTVGELVEHFYKVVGSGSVSTEFENAQTMKEQGFLLIDPSDANEMLNWHAKLSVEDAVAWSAEWYSGWLADKTTSRELMARQIRAFESR